MKEEKSIEYLEGKAACARGIVTHENESQDWLNGYSEQYAKEVIQDHYTGEDYD